MINNGKKLPFAMKIKKLKKCNDVTNNIDFTSEPYGSIKTVIEDDNYSTNTDDDGKITQD